MLEHFSYKEIKSVLKSAIGSVSFQNPTPEELIRVKAHDIYFVTHLSKEQKSLASKVLQVLNLYFKNEYDLKKYFAQRDKFVGTKPKHLSEISFDEFEKLAHFDYRELIKQNENIKNALNSILPNFVIKDADKITREVKLDIKPLSKSQRTLLNTIFEQKTQER